MRCIAQTEKNAANGILEKRIRIVAPFRKHLVNFIPDSYRNFAPAIALLATDSANHTIASDLIAGQMSGLPPVLRRRWNSLSNHHE